ncbi:connexin 27.5 [Elysia marginata]|uniref:Connexin 27.5 n=1 Tax=Elysia marginata TaxID=1093978 RepID=A0AAV4J8U3_9GAST|nr:connexin 27.5 [Elysia marginata]
MDQLKMLKHGTTRWLSIGRCLTRLLKNWEPLKLFSKKECKRKDSSAHAKKKSEKILTVLRSRSTRLYLMFLQYTIQPFESFLTVHQSDAPKTSTIMADSKKLIKALMSCFVAPSAFGGNKSVLEVQYKLPYNVLANKDILVGEECQKFISNKDKNKLSDSKLKEFYSNVKKFFTVTVDYLLKSLPLSDPVLTKLSITDPASLPESSSNSIRFLAQRYPVLIAANSSLDTVLEQFVNLQCSMPVDLEVTRVDEFWVSCSQMTEGTSKLYDAISFFMLGLLTIPHSSAHCERVFSCVRKIKTDQRSSMAPKTLESLLVLKHRQNSTFNVNELSPATLRQLKGAYTASLSK